MLEVKSSQELLLEESRQCPIEAFQARVVKKSAAGRPVALAQLLRSGRSHPAIPGNKNFLHVSNGNGDDKFTA